MLMATHRIVWELRVWATEKGNMLLVAVAHPAPQKKSVVRPTIYSTYCILVITSQIMSWNWFGKPDHVVPLSLQKSRPMSITRQLPLYNKGNIRAPEVRRMYYKDSVPNSTSEIKIDVEQFLRNWAWHQVTIWYSISMYFNGELEQATATVSVWIGQFDVITQRIVAVFLFPFFFFVQVPWIISGVHAVQPMIQGSVYLLES